MQQQGQEQRQAVDFNTRTPFVLALDVGTSSTRALLFDATGAAVPGIQAQDTAERQQELYTLLLGEIKE